MITSIVLYIICIMNIICYTNKKGTTFLAANIVMLLSNVVLSILNINKMQNNIISGIVLLGFLLSIILFIASYFTNKKS
ncbi:hypothetical protein HMPREF3083_03435 [Clostridium sp. HMSC19D07]|nr:hypothetical protein HMPREF3083_03435 [Clostridium sp. HMSC19D07]VHU51429.1 Uncharacterised protein [Clostridioides difficile]VHX12655.1 Uncharacterised protein [Clostridioides difficile]